MKMLTIDAQLKHHARGHWSLQWLCPDTNRWRVEHFGSEKDARSYIQFRSRHQWNITKQSNAGRYVQIGYWHGA